MLGGKTEVVEVPGSDGTLLGEADAEFWIAVDEFGLQSWGGNLRPLHRSSFLFHLENELAIRLRTGEVGRVMVSRHSYKYGEYGARESAEILGNGPVPFAPKTPQD